MSNETETETGTEIETEVPPHARPNMLRVCFDGVLTLEEAQKKIDEVGSGARVLEVRPAQGVSKTDPNGPLIAATEVIFEIVELDDDASSVDASGDAIEHPGMLTDAGRYPRPDDGAISWGDRPLDPSATYAIDPSTMQVSTTEERPVYGFMEITPDSPGCGHHRLMLFNHDEPMIECADCGRAWSFMTPPVPQRPSLPGEPMKFDMGDVQGFVVTIEKPKSIESPLAPLTSADFEAHTNAISASTDRTSFVTAFAPFARAIVGRVGKEYGADSDGYIALAHFVSGILEGAGVLPSQVPGMPAVTSLTPAPPSDFTLRALIEEACGELEDTGGEFAKARAAEIRRAIGIGTGPGAEG